ncbi:hypothetical protein [Sulfuriflexus sp.]|uniref:hypothetical protein n=1 Tax=Sulfuriflexus sp. TaxID=2015443 RepID=UPI0028CC3D40|nr:hypothetical protein [Sulfuriflexus sp.]MDT8405076.1 hypothetical protein [Sulfuriflexus sp.]
MERKLLEKLFIDMWDNLDEEGRVKVLEEMDTNGVIMDRGAIVAMSGSAVIGILSATAYWRRAAQMQPFIMQMHILKADALNCAGLLNDTLRRLGIGSEVS